MPLSKILLWTGFGVAVRLWQLGIEMRPFFNRGSLWVYPIYAGIGGTFGYWLNGVEARQIDFLQRRRESLLEKRRRRAERDGLEGAGVLAGDDVHGEGGSTDIGGGARAGRTGVGLTGGEGRHAGMGKAYVYEQGAPGGS